MNFTVHKLHFYCSLLETINVILYAISMKATYERLTLFFINLNKLCFDWYSKMSFEGHIIVFFIIANKVTEVTSWPLCGLVERMIKLKVHGCGMALINQSLSTQIGTQVFTDFCSFHPYINCNESMVVNVIKTSGIA